MNSELRTRFDASYTPEPMSGCWLWTSSYTSNGYGEISIGGRSNREVLRAHRLSWAIFRGPIPEGMLVCHKCDNPPCCNPDHLFLGTQSDNMRDMVRKGRNSGVRAKGENNGASKLTEAQISEMRSLYNTCWTQAEIARRFGVGTGTVSNVVNRKVWKHV